MRRRLESGPPVEASDLRGEIEAIADMALALHVAAGPDATPPDSTQT